MIKIAIVMLIHRKDEQTVRLIRYLSRDFHVFVHIDKKSSVCPEDIIDQNVYAYKELKVYWGGYSQILAVQFLLEKAFKKGYDRYLLISGQDLPIKSNEQIIRFFYDNDKEYISIEEKVEKGTRQKGGLDRVTKYWPNWFHRGGSLWDKYLFSLQYFLFAVYSKVSPRATKYDFYKGPNWLNITHGCLEKIMKFLDDHPEYIRRFKWTNCADEFFYQTIVMQLENLQIENDSLRYIDWNDIEYPKVLRDEDYQKLTESHCLFARKFDANIDMEIINRVYRFITTS